MAWLQGANFGLGPTTRARDVSALAAVLANPNLATLASNIRQLQTQLISVRVSSELSRALSTVALEPGLSYEVRELVILHFMAPSAMARAQLAKIVCTLVLEACNGMDATVPIFSSWNSGESLHDALELARAVTA